MGEMIGLVCDKCRCQISNPLDGWLEWIKSDKGEGFGFRVCHSRSDDNKNCFSYGQSQKAYGLCLYSLRGQPGMMEMVDLLVQHQAIRASWAQMFRRLWECGLFDEE